MSTRDSEKDERKLALFRMSLREASTSFSFITSASASASASAPSEIAGKLSSSDTLNISVFRRLINWNSRCTSSLRFLTSAFFSCSSDATTWLSSHTKRDKAELYEQRWGMTRLSWKDQNQKVKNGAKMLLTVKKDRKSTPLITLSTARVCLIESSRLPDCPSSWRSAEKATNNSSLLSYNASYNDTGRLYLIMQKESRQKNTLASAVRDDSDQTREVINKI